jgi:hypothetical protein
MNPPAMFASFSTTKTLAHVLQLPESDVLPCPGMIPKSFILGYRELYHRKLGEACERQEKKAVMSDSIDDIQERMLVAMPAASASAILEGTASTNNCSVIV